MKSFNQYAKYQESFVENAIAEATQRLLNEADTSRATNAEMAICVAYNMKKGMNQDEAATAAGVLDDEKKWIGLLDLGNNIVSNAQDWGDILTHSGKDSGNKAHKGGGYGANSTSKSDIRGDVDHMISLKQTGAPIMSGKGGGDAQGVFTFALKHYGKQVRKAKYKDALFILRDRMKATAKTEQVIRAGAGKAEFTDWYATKSDRVKDLKDVERRDIEKYLRAELSMLGIPKNASKAQIKLISKYPDITPITRNEVDEYTKTFGNTKGSWTIGTSSGRSREEIIIGADHLASIDKDPEAAIKILGGDPLMKKQIADVVRTSMEAQDWKTTLDAAFAEDDEFRKWIMYEAGSGYGKFTGEKKNGWSKYTPGKRSIANYMVVWNDGGVSYQDDMITYAQNNHSKVGKLDITYKSSARSSYIKFGISTSYEHELPMLQEELDRLGAQYMLNEGIFRDLYTSAKNKLKKLADKVKEALIKFWENVIMKFINGLLDLLNEGIDKFAEALGITGTVSIGNA